MPDRIEQTRAVYDEIAIEYASRIASELEGKPLDRALLDVFAMSIGTGPRVCDAGCGPGHVARYLRDRGVNVYGLDLSPAMVSEAIRRNPDIEFRTGDLTDLAGEPSDLAGIVAFYSLIHLPRERVTPALRNIRRHLRERASVHRLSHRHRRAPYGRVVGTARLCRFHILRGRRNARVVQQAGFALEWVVEREPYAGVEHPTRRAYALARRLDSVSTTAPPTSG